MTPAGQLDRIISLQAPSTTRDPVEGDLVPTWSTMLPQSWARLIERQVASGEQGNQAVMTRSITLRIRYRSDVMPTWRALLGSRVLNITGTLEIGRREFLDLICTEVVSG